LLVAVVAHRLNPQNGILNILLRGEIDRRESREKVF